MIRNFTLGLTTAALVAAGVGLAGGSVAQADVVVGIDDSSAPWLGYMNVFELPENGGGFVFGSSWGVPDLVAEFDDAANELTMLPNSIGDPDPFWYQGGGGPGAPGNKIMQANLYQEVIGDYAGMMVTFEGNVEAFSFTDAHDVSVFIRDFAPDFSSSNDVFQTIDSTGNFSISLNTDAGAGRPVQWGIQVEGVNVWITDIAPFGSATFTTVAIPEPTSIAMFGLAGVGLLARRRR